MAEGDYTSESIQVLNGRAAVRKRPGMYIGDVENGTGMHYMLWEIFENALDEGTSAEVAIEIAGERVTIEDDGRGIPVDQHPTDGRSALEIVMTEPHVGIGRPPRRWVRCGGMHGVGIAAVNALSSELEVTTHRGGRRYVQRYERGEARTPVEDRGPATRTGTRISFVPDWSILTRRAWDMKAIGARCDELAMLLPGMTVRLNGESVRYADGIVDRVRERSGWEDPFHVRTTQDGIDIELAIACAAKPSIDTFVNITPSPEGTHVSGLFAGLATVLSPRVPMTRARRHLVAVLHVMLEDPHWGSFSKTCLRNSEVSGAVQTIVERELVRYLAEAPAFLDALLLLTEQPRAARRGKPAAARRFSEGT